MIPVEQLGTWMLSIGLSLPRIAAAFIILPLLTKENMPSMVRNSLFVSLAIVIFPLTVTAATVTSLSPSDWPFIILKEMFIGSVIGLLFGSIFWAISVAGGIIDTQMGANMANSLDPIQGHQTTLTGRWLSQFAALLFMTSGGFMIFLDVLLSSYQLWPAHHLFPNLNLSSASFFSQQFSYIMTTALLLAAPAILLLALVDLCFGLINRFAQQINVLALSLPIKSWVATWIMMLNLGLIMEIVIRKLYENREILQILKQLF